MPIDRLAEIFSALVYLHDRALLHRDIKLDNVVCTGVPSPNALKLIDFALCTSVHRVCTTLCGTPAYMAPELLSLTSHALPPGYGFEVDA